MMAGITVEQVITGLVSFLGGAAGLELVRGLLQRRKTRAEADATESDALGALMTGGVASILDRYKTEVDRLSKQHEALAVKIAELEADNIDMRGKQAISGLTIERLRSDLDTANDRIRVLEKALDAANAREDEDKAEIDRLKAALRTERERNAVMHDEIETLRSRVAELESKNEG